MTKIEFLEHLEKRLQVLNKKECEDILSEYAQHIDFKMESGLSEAEAIHDFGNLEELAAEILDAYNVNPDYHKKTNQLDARLLGKGVANSIVKTGNRVKNLSSRSCQGVKTMFGAGSSGILKKVGSRFLMAGIVLAIYLPLVGIVFLIANSLYTYLDSPLDGLAAYGFMIVFHLCLLFLVYSVYHDYMLRKRRGTKEEIDGKLILNRVRSGALKKIMNLFILPGYSKEKQDRKNRKESHYMEKAGNLIRRCVILILKGVGICLVAPVVLFQLFMVIAFGTLVVLLVIGYPFIGLTIAALGILLSGFSLILFVGSFIFTKKAGTKV